jgi:uncharacterized protein (DUF305 family)
MSKYLTTSIATVTLITGIGIGYIITPQYAMSNSENAAMTGDLGKADKYVDQRFINAMIAHHKGAIEMAKQAQANSKRDEVKSIASAIIETQQKEVDKLMQWKKDWYKDTKQVNNFEKVNFGKADQKFDLRFVNAMIIHHEDAVMMAKDIQQKSLRSEVLQLADDIISAQSKEISIMKDWRFSWYGVGEGELMSEANGMLGNADKRVDLRYLEGMIVHHRGAMQLAEQVKEKSHRKEIRDLATMILNDEPKSIDELYRWRNEWYKEDSKVADEKVANLGSNDDKLDLRFLNAIIAHHDKGIEMTKEIRTKSSRNEILNNADTAEEFFITTKKTFEQWRNNWYNTGNDAQM